MKSVRTKKKKIASIFFVCGDHCDDSVWPSKSVEFQFELMFIFCSSHHSTCSQLILCISFQLCDIQCILSSNVVSRWHAPCVECLFRFRVSECQCVIYVLSKWTIMDPRFNRFNHITYISMWTWCRNDVHDTSNETSNDNCSQHRRWVLVIILSGKINAFPNGKSKALDRALAVSVKIVRRISRIVLCHFALHKVLCFFFYWLLRLFW